MIHLRLIAGIGWNGSGFSASFHDRSRHSGQFLANRSENRRYLRFAALRRGSDFGMVPADLRPPFWAGRASILCARSFRGDGVGLS
jgi:hypothetical protein